MTRRRLTAVTAAAALLGALGACGPQGTDPSAPTTETDPPAPTPTDTPTGTDEPDPDALRPIAAVTAQGEVVLVDAQDGSVVERLLEDVDVTDPAANGIAVTPDGETVLVVRPSPEVGEDELVAIDVEDGSTSVLANGRAPAVSPDGQTLAYTVAENGAAPDPTVVLHDLGSGEEQVLAWEDEPAEPYIGGITWTADSTRLVLTAGEIRTGLHVVDAEATSLDEAWRLGPSDTTRDWRAAAVMTDGRLAVAEAVPGEDPTQVDRWTVVVVDLEDGSLTEEPLPVDRVDAGVLGAPPGQARGLLVVEGVDPQGGELMVWDGADELRDLRDEVVTAAW